MSAALSETAFESSDALVAAAMEYTAAPAETAVQKSCCICREASGNTAAYEAAVESLAALAETAFESSAELQRQRWSTLLHQQRQRFRTLLHL